MTGNKRRISEVDTSEDEECVNETQSTTNNHLDRGTTFEGIYIPPPLEHQRHHIKDNRRLIITKVVNNYFKSYGEDVVIGPLHKCFNAIIGPNGNGKSNVIDALLFVFGYRATKIRSKKMSVLIHNSSTFTNVPSCNVAVHFVEIIDVPGDKYEIVPGTEKVISRTVHKDNSTFYELNGQRVPFKEIANFLRNFNIDLDHNRFLILQGEVEQIAMMKCKGENENETGMLEYLEDVIGTIIYKKPLKELCVKADILTEKTVQKLSSLKIVEEDVNSLKELVDKAVNFLRVENSIVESKNLIYQKEKFDVEQKLAEEMEEKSKLDVICEEIDAKHQAIVDEKNEKVAILKEKSTKYESLISRRNKLEKAFNEANKKDVHLMADMTEINKNRKKYKSQLVEERKKLETFIKVPEKNVKNIKECEAKEQEIMLQKQKLETEKNKILNIVRKDTAPLQDQKQQLEEKLIGLMHKVDETKSKHTLIETELQMSKSDEQNEKLKYEKLKMEYEKHTRELQEKLVERRELEKNLNGLNENILKMRKECELVKNKEDTLYSKVRNEFGDLEEKIQSMRANSSKNNVLNALMKLKRDGTIPGIYGRLGDLGAIDAKYDVAISTACGPLDNIVVDTAVTAQSCIEHLKRYNIGSATFIALDKQEHLRGYAESRIATPENVDRLYDLIQIPDKRICTAFYYALRNTLVVDILDTALRIAYGEQRWRVVTLRGDVIETSGAISGGGGRVIKGRMGAKVVTESYDPEKLELRRKQLKKMEDDHKTLHEHRIKLESDIKTDETTLKHLQTTNECCQNKLNLLQNLIAQLEQQMEAQGVRCTRTHADPKVVKQLEQELAKAWSACETANQNANVIKQQIIEVDAKIDEKGVGQLKLLDRKLGEIDKQLNTCKNEVKRLKLGIQTSARDVQKTESKIQNLEKNVSESEKRLLAIQENRKEIETDAAKLLKIIEEIKAELGDSEENHDEMKQEVEQLTKKINGLSSKKIGIENQIKGINTKISGIKMKIQEFNNKLKSLQLQKIPDEDPQPLKQYNETELSDTNLKREEQKLKKNEDAIKDQRPNLSVIAEYKEKEAVFLRHTNEYKEIRERKVKTVEIYNKLHTQRKDDFMIGFNLIKTKLKEIYQMMTFGGDAELELIDTFDPFRDGVRFNVRPPRKSWKNISNLSGGEKTLSSLALVFALHHYKPSPLYVMDEIDAALDFRNVSIVANFIKERTKNAQFIIISLRSDMYELSNHLVGIYKRSGCTFSVTINPHVYDEV